VIGFVDNDIIVKLATFDLYDEALAALGVGYHEAFVLDTAKFKLGAAGQQAGVEKAKRRLGDKVHQRVVDFLHKVHEVKVAPPSPAHALLCGVPNIDPGEAILIAAAADEETSLLVTGDKKAVRAFAATGPCAPLVEALQGRFVCLEQILLRVMDRIGFQPLLQKVVPVMECDSSIRSAFGSGYLAQEHNVRAALVAYVREVRGFDGGVLAADAA
jgi:hypothetical protein